MHGAQSVKDNLIAVVSVAVLAVFTFFLVNSAYGLPLLVVLFGFAFFLSLVVMPLDKCIILVSILAAFNFTYTFFSGFPPMAEPIYLKLMKDVFVLAIFLNYLSKNLLSGKFRLFKFSSLIPLVLFLVYLLFLSFFSIYQMASSLVFFRYLLVYPFLIFAVVKGFDSLDKIKKYFRVFVCLGVIMAILAILQFFFPLGNNPFKCYVVIFGQSFGRSIAMLGNPNNLAHFLSITIISFMVLKSKKFGGLIKGSYIYLIGGILFLGLFATFSRSSMAMLFFMLFLFFVLKKPSLIRFIIAFMSTLFVFPVIVLISSLRTGAALEFFGDQRFVLWDNLFSQIVSLDLNGFLLGDSFAANQSKLSILANPGLSVTSDNLYLLLWVYCGFIGLVLFLFCMFYILKINFVFYFKVKDPFAKGVSLIVFLSVLFFLLAGIFSQTLALYPGAFYFWIFIGFLFSLLKIEGRQKAIG